MSELTDTISGLPHIGPLHENDSKSKTTAGLQVQKVSYNLSEAIFNFTPPTFDLDKALLKWQSQKSANVAGSIPKIYPLETRVGASLALLGYLDKTETAGLTTVVAASGTLNVMEPVLSRHVDNLKQHQVVFQVAAVDYDVVSGQLVADDSSVGRVTRNLGLPLISSSLALENDAVNSSVLASVIGSSVSPAVHVYDGIRGTRQAYSAPPVANLPKELPSASSLLDAFKVTNELLGTRLSPFEYYGAAEPSTVYVTLGLPSVLARATPNKIANGTNGYATNGHAAAATNGSATNGHAAAATNGSANGHATDNSNIGVINVRLYSPFLGDEFLAALPDSAIRIVVVGKTLDLYKDVSATIRLHYGFKAGPTVLSEVVGYFNESGPPSLQTLPSEQGFTAKVWDSDKAKSAVVGGKLTALLPEGNVYTKFDNYVAGGVVQSDIRLKFHKQFWGIKEADVALVNYANVLKSVDVTAGIKPKGKLVVAATSDEEVNKIVPGQLKLNAKAKELEVYRVDYSKIDPSSTEGRTLFLAGQAVLWLLSGSDVDQATSLLVHANSWDTELIAATVNQIVTTLKESALVPVSEDTYKEWAKVELTDKEKSAKYLSDASTTSFIGVPASTAKDTEESVPGEQIETTNKLGLKKRLIFSEAFSQACELRPEVPTKTFVSKVKANERVTPADYDRHIFHLELDITGTGLKYAIGEALGIHAPNNTEASLKFLESYGIDPEASYGVPVSNSAETGLLAFRTAFQIVRDHLDLFGKAPKRFYEALAGHATNEEQKKLLERLASPEGAEELKQRAEEDFQNYVDVLNEFDSARPSFAELIDLISPLKRREYSIASSQKVHPNEVHLLIVVVDWANKKGEKRYGQCSKFLADLPKGSEVVVSVKPSVMKLPKDPMTPIIMAGLGTGLAPFKAFLEEKMYQRDQGAQVGPVYLFLGSRHQRQEYLYGELFEAYKEAGILTHIGAAFSRDQPEKIYIQHRIQQAKTELVDAFVRKGGNFYLCGPTWPVPDISAALTDIVLTGSAETGATVNEATLIETLKDEERYILEVY